MSVSGTFHLDIKLGFRDIGYALFRKKICPECNGPLERRWQTVDKGRGWDTDRRGLKFEFSYGERAEMYLTYSCLPCERTWRARDLWRRKGGQG